MPKIAKLFGGKIRGGGGGKTLKGLDVKPFKIDEQTLYGDPGVKGTGMEWSQ